MKIIKRTSSDIPREEAHGGSGSRKVYADKSLLESAHLDAMTHGYLPAGQSFDWHDHTAIEEIMFVLRGNGSVGDEDGDYDYNTGDVFIFPADTRHRIINNSKGESEMIFVRVHL